MVGFGFVQMAAINACTDTACHLGMLLGSQCVSFSSISNWYNSFVLKTKEQRAAEKALMDKSPLKTLTLEDFLESERHKLTGNLTPVTPETFAKWKKERLDKKAAEEEARKAKDASGRAMFESGDWNASDSEDDDGDAGDDDWNEWNMESLRKETERLREQSEEDRIAKLHGTTSALTSGTGSEERPTPVDGAG